MHRDLSSSLSDRLAVRTEVSALELPPSHAVTAWHKGGISNPLDYTKYAWDREGDKGLYNTWFPTGRVHWLESEGCWRWQAFYPGGARSGLSVLERSRGEEPLLAMGRVDAYLELYCLWTDELRGTVTTKHAPEPLLSPEDVSRVVVSPRGHILSEWSRVKMHTGGSNVDRYVRAWMYRSSSLSGLSSSDHQGVVAQRAFPRGHHSVKLMQRGRGSRWEWSIHGVGEGRHKTKDGAARMVAKALISDGSMLRPRKVSLFSIEQGFRLVDAVS